MSRISRRSAIGVALAAGLAACVAAPEPAATPAPDSGAQLGATRYWAVLVAGDGSLPAWDNAVQRLSDGLAAGGGMAGPMRRLSAADAVIAAGAAEPATLPRVIAAVEALRPGPGEGCLVFATAHGGQGQGLALARSRQFLSPAALDAALLRGCGSAPTVVVISGCYTGNFARAPMARPNRIVLTAARPDQPSFGCGAGRTYTVYDECLLGALEAGGSGGWRGAATRTRACVTAQEATLGAAPSEPQAHFGAGAAGLPVPFTRGDAAARPPGGKPAGWRGLSRPSRCRACSPPRPSPHCLPRGSGSPRLGSRGGGQVKRRFHGDDRVAGAGTSVRRYHSPPGGPRVPNPRGGEAVKGGKGRWKRATAAARAGRSASCSAPGPCA